MKRDPKYKIGDQVRFSHAYLSSIQASYEIANLKGTVTAIKSFSNSEIPDLISVAWNDGTSQRVLNKNLTSVNFDVTE
jgi:hypothetical protein